MYVGVTLKDGQGINWIYSSDNESLIKLTFYVPRDTRKAANWVVPLCSRFMYRHVSWAELTNLSELTNFSIKFHNN